ncbi:acyl carrier protein [Candidatus Bipolaricaulota bacterium]
MNWGGHSLLAVHAINRIDKALDVRVPIQIFFDRPTIANLASFIDDTSDREEAV